MVAPNPDYAPSETRADAKNRVGGFFFVVAGSAGKNRLLSRTATKEKTGYVYETASGRPVWPSRDPIGERGGLNLYLFSSNNAVNYFDYLGNQVLFDQTFRPRLDLFLVWVEFEISLKIEGELNEGVEEADCPTIRPSLSGAGLDFEFNRGRWYVEPVLIASSEGVELRIGGRAGLTTNGSGFWDRLLNTDVDFTQFNQFNVEAQKWFQSRDGKSCVCASISSESSVSYNFGFKSGTAVATAGAAAIAFAPVSAGVGGAVTAGSAFVFAAAQ